ncbi:MULTISPECIES: cytochrome P450 [unclassified Haladaptatus]|uniref:cytochrome P450 n=1 Tax=unclassified Haladaptatus TaxID=2622732 RepID=UPI0023E8205B|nr:MULTISPECIES: cytochrome P450 [unclassified Haladaptatus]
MSQQLAAPMPVDDQAPGPAGVPLLGNTLQFGRDAFSFLRECAARYGDVVNFTVLGRQFYQLNHPAHIEHVLIHNQKNYQKGSFLTAQFDDFIGEGLLLSDGALWRQQRQLVQPAFHPTRIARFADTMTAFTTRLLDTWQGDVPQDLQPQMSQLTLEIVAHALFDVDIREDERAITEAVNVVLAHLVRRTSSPLTPPMWVPTPSNRRYRRALDTLDGILTELIVERRTAGAAGDDVISMLLRAEADSGTPQTDEQLKDELLTLLFAGHETTAVALTFAVHSIATHPEVTAKFEAELDTVLGGRTPTFADVCSLTYTENIVKEALRLYPPVFGIIREAIEPDEIGGYRIPAGAVVAMNQLVVHRDPRYFESPDEFDPDRWTEAFAARLPRFAYFPFGGGPRKCIGERFAMLEAVLVLATMYQRFRFDLISERDLNLKPSITTRPKSPIVVVPRRRSA